MCQLDEQTMKPFMCGNVTSFNDDVAPEYEFRSNCDAFSISAESDLSPSYFLVPSEFGNCSVPCSTQ